MNGIDNVIIMTWLVVAYGECMEVLRSEDANDALLIIRTMKINDNIMTSCNPIKNWARKSFVGDHESPCLVCYMTDIVVSNSDRRDGMMNRKSARGTDSVRSGWHELVHEAIKQRIADCTIQKV